MKRNRTEQNILLLALAGTPSLNAFLPNGNTIPSRLHYAGVTGALPNADLIDAETTLSTITALPLWAAVILLSIAAALALVWLYLDKVRFKGHDGTPDSAAWFTAMKVVSAWRKHKQKLTVDDKKLKGLKAPFVVLCNHVSFYDFYYMSELMKNYKPAYVINHHITSAPVLRFFSKKAGMIPKKMFYPDTAAVKIVRTLKAGYPVVVFPEGRLSADGRSSPIVESAAALYRRIGVPLVLAHISGAYFTYPKWRGKFFRGDVSIAVKRVLTPSELKQMTVEEIERAIEDTLTYNASDHPVNSYRQKNKARGLENLLYRCADCGALYTTRSRGNDLFCSSCGKAHHLNESYLFDGEIGSIPVYLDRIREMEKAELDDLVLRAEVDVKVFSDQKPRVRKEQGVCTLNKEAFSYHSDRIEFSVPTEKLPALAFSCGTEFELYHKGEQYYFYPKQDRSQVCRWSLIVDLLRERRGTPEPNDRS